MLRRVTEDVLVHQSPLLQNNTVVVQGPDGVLVVDPGLTETEFECLTGDLRSLRCVALAGFATHPDWDHVLWHTGLGEVPRYGTARCAAAMAEFRSMPDWRERARQGLPPEILEETPLELFGLLTSLPGNATEIPWDGPRVRVLEHPGHAAGHAALFVEEAGVLIAGDMLSDLFVPMPDHEGAADAWGDYRSGLDVLEEVAHLAALVIPGHGSVGGAGQAAARLAQDRAYVAALADQREVTDPRVTSPAPGWEWVGTIHEGNVQSLACR